jgi:hypothetical protein
MRFGLLLCWLLAGPATAQTILDRSLTESDSQLLAGIVAALIAETSDPYSAQIIRLRAYTKEADLFCGLINLKNGSGGYTGFSPFSFYDREEPKIYLRLVDACYK